MLRLRLPNGILSSQQMRCLASLVREYGDQGCADITTRQNIQLRGVTLPDAPSVLDALRQVSWGKRSARTSTRVCHKLCLRDSLLSFRSLSSHSPASRWCHPVSCCRLSPLLPSPPPSHAGVSCLHPLCVSPHLPSPQAGLTSMPSGMDNVRNIVGSPLAGIDPHELADTRPFVHRLEALIVGEGEGEGEPGRGRGSAEYANL